ncbi:HAD family hydrolase [Cellulosilyticum sp. I15G10I2]|uniref:HAD family hydrolase n=1 Tax=Cellulosilyticum sp. I15G10I2 TaxID=1892843 RepID=UPI0009F4C698|nr:HAD family hydrolase [Cellulosilyticum sp. I15G10I2]
MIPFKSIKTIFFDYDGTLHNSLTLYAPAFRKAYAFLVANGYADAKTWSDQEIGYWLGFNPQDMWQTFMPKLSEKMREKCSGIIGEEMKHQISETKPFLYEGAEEVLRYLKEKHYHLIFISNCKTYYKEYHTKLFGLDQYFESLICSDEYNFIPKHEILNKVKDHYPEERVIVGDRKQDMEAGQKNDIYTIGCTYGFAKPGELDRADLKIDDIRALKKYL